MISSNQETFAKTAYTTEPLLSMLQARPKFVLSMSIAECISCTQLNFIKLAIDVFILRIKNAVCPAQVILDNWTKVQMDCMGSLGMAKTSMQIS